VVLRTLGATLVVLASIGGVAMQPASTGGLPSPIPQAGSLRGRVDIGHILSSSRPAPRPGGADDAMGSAPDVYRQAVVYLDPPPERLEKPSDARARMDQKNERFIPHLLAIASGTVVDFPNDDRIYHNVFSLSKTKRFDLGRYATGKSKAVRFDEPGVVRVFCEIHSHMNAFILVFDHRFFALTDEEGRFRIDRVPPGTYQVTAWYEGVLRQTQTVTVAAAAGAEVNFVLK
jgi:plastocyanin